MPADQIISLIIQERDKLNRAIEALEGTKCRGRPPKNTVALVSSEPSPNGKYGRTFNASQGKAQAKRMNALLGGEKENLLSNFVRAVGYRDEALR
jgi:hypothetical protein